MYFPIDSEQADLIAQQATLVYEGNDEDPIRLYLHNDGCLYAFNYQQDVVDLLEHGPIQALRWKQLMI